MTVYATRADLVVYGLPVTALGNLSTATQDAALAAASAKVDAFLRGRYLLPLLAWDTEITDVTCRIAAYNLMAVRGFNNAAGADTNLRERYEDAMEWLGQVQRQAAHPDVTPSPSSTPSYQQPTVITSSVVNLGNGATARTRGW